MLEELSDIKERIDAVRTKVGDKKSSPVNFNGFLCGQTSAYLDCFDSQIKEMNARMAKEQEYWAERKLLARVSEPIELGLAASNAQGKVRMPSSASWKQCCQYTSL